MPPASLAQMSLKPSLNPYDPSVAIFENIPGFNKDISNRIEEIQKEISRTRMMNSLRHPAVDVIKINHHHISGKDVKYDSLTAKPIASYSMTASQLPDEALKFILVPGIPVRSHPTKTKKAFSHYSDSGLKNFLLSTS